ncbi:FAD-binding oxidoreductase [Lichenihabitans sp. Uapishka_5]|uniref:NAD(P)/FAD-dependent oxidoreductase n=1 Tax=Lichenihabitans sp. Uapishka_5 TaxID=3037302 RepID=UPI0029E7E76E|nr:FAD-binding oxidoreductase [Lichenihabitans sp. Uapishka_5]MDX7950544.1 FAD-binding oxidoreductase [Lichenihabitans sp. Uapishka_5]
MEFTSYWKDTATPFAHGCKGPVEGNFDVAVVGGGFTGLAAARALARAGVKVALFEAREVGYGASGRNGGHVNNGLAHSYLSAKAMLGEEQAKRLYWALDSAVDAVEQVVQEEQIDCAFRRGGKLKLASKPSHVEGLRSNFEAIHREVDPDTAFLERADLASEVGSDRFHGAMLSRKSAMMHMGRYVAGLAYAAHRHGATLWENAPVTARRREGGRWRLTTPRGEITATDMIAATDAYTSGPFDYYRRRIVSVGAFILATRPLTPDEVARVMPGDRTCVTTMNVGNFFRLSPDKRLIWGGRARFSTVSDQRSDAKSGHILRQALARTFPELANVEIDHCWGGLVGMTRDRFPRAGQEDGVWHAMGYSGHGAQMATHMGNVLAEMVLGRPDANPMHGMRWDAFPLYSGKPWFMPVVGMYYKLKDMVS